MAKNKKLTGVDFSTNPLAKTTTRTAAPAEAPAEKKTVINPPISVYLTADEKASLKEIADKEKVTVHAMMQYALKRFIRDYTAGRIKPETDSTRRKLKI